MAEVEVREMSRHEFSIAYDGKGLADSAIEVQVLAPALLAFGKLIREANTQFNGKKSTAKVLVVSDFEHKCFNINFEVVVGLLEQVKTLLGFESVKTAKEVLEWLGLLGVPTSVTGVLSYLSYLRWKKGRKVIDASPLKDIDRSGIVEIRVEGDGNSVQVQNNVYLLSENPRALRATRDAFLPLGQDGFDRVRINGGAGLAEEIDLEAVDAIVKSCNVGIEESKEPEPPEIEVTPAWLSVYSPVFDMRASKWHFRLGKEVISADISETNIAKQALDRGEVGVEDAYQVKLEITTEVDPQGGKKEPKYKVLEVIRFVPAPPTFKQSSMFDLDKP